MAEIGTIFKAAFCLRRDEVGVLMGPDQGNPEPGGVEPPDENSQRSESERAEDSSADHADLNSSSLVLSLFSPQTRSLMGGRSDIELYFAAVAEDVFCSQLGITDPPLVDYLSGLLGRFVLTEQVYSKAANGELIERMDLMLIEAESTTGERQVVQFRRVGDVALFRSGLYPESLSKSSEISDLRPIDAYHDYGKRAYGVAAELIEVHPYFEDTVGVPSSVFSRLSDLFEMCAYGLGQIRKNLNFG